MARLRSKQKQQKDKRLQQVSEANQRLFKRRHALRSFNELLKAAGADILVLDAKEVPTPSQLDRVFQFFRQAVQRGDAAEEVLGGFAVVGWQRWILT